MRVKRPRFAAVLAAALAVLSWPQAASAATLDNATSLPVVIRLTNGVDAAALTAALGPAAHARAFDHIDGVVTARVSPAQLDGLRRNAGVLAVVPQGLFHTDPPGPITVPPCADPTACQFTVRSVRRIDAQNSSTKSGNGRGGVPVNVAVVDTGVQPSVDLNVVGGVDCVGDGRGALTDPVGHGTIIGGLLGAYDNDRYVVGVAPGARIFSVRVLDVTGGADDSNLLCGLDWILGTHTDADPSNDIQVVNLSLGDQAPATTSCLPTSTDAVHLAICKLVDAGIVVVAGAGNDAEPIESTIPASYPEVLTVAGMSDGDGTWGGHTPDPCEHFPDDAFAPFSNFARNPATAAHLVAAPAVCASSLYPSNDFNHPEVAVDTGTSYATPLAAGVVALCIYSGACRGLDARSVVRKIVTDANLNGALYPYFGFKGDPLHPAGGRIYGPLVRAGLY
ncbi:MAG TPA: S8 family serine peptidase [Acidimicrobiales bacterium]|nr:S8 family serine peptidase [Acidimicrobiales bacterium]